MSRLDLKHTTGQLSSPPGCNPRFCTTLPLAILSLACSESFVKSSPSCDLELAEPHSFVDFQFQTDSDASVAAGRIG